MVECVVVVPHTCSVCVVKAGFWFGVEDDVEEVTFGRVEEVGVLFEDVVGFFDVFRSGFFYAYL